MLSHLSQKAMVFKVMMGIKINNKEMNLKVISNKMLRIN